MAEVELQQKRTFGRFTSGGDLDPLLQGSCLRVADAAAQPPGAALGCGGSSRGAEV